MNIYVWEKGIILSGKAWEIKAKLKEYRNNYNLVKDWIEGVNQNNPYKGPSHRHSFQLLIDNNELYAPKRHF